MSIQFKTPSQAADDYLTHLKALKPEINRDQVDSDWYVRSRVVGGLFSGIYADQRKIADDAFPQSARHEALERHLNLYFDEGFAAATQSQGTIRVTGATGTTIPVTQEFIFDSNGNVYVPTAEVTLAATAELITVQSVDAGQAQNLLEGASLTVDSPVAGLDSSASVSGGDLSDGRDAETDEEAVTRILARIRDPLAGGKVTDYQQWATDADASVVSASVLRHPFGLGTVAIYIAAGTTDIDAAIDAGDAIILTPSDDLIATVQDYIDEHCPVTDCPYVLAPQELEVDVTVYVRFAAGDSSTIPNGETLTQAELVQREVQRALYKTPVGGRQFDDIGYVVASEIEEVIDLALSASPHAVGELELLVDRQVADLSATGSNLMVLNNQLIVPGTITVTEL